MDVLFWIALSTLLITAFSAADLFFGMRKLIRLATITPLEGDLQPRVSIIVPACNESENIEKAIKTHLRQRYKNLEILAINDRSTDNTGQLLDSMKSRFPELEVVHIRELPSGWMGKNHALHVGAQKASGEYLLFTDGDILMEQTTIARAMNYIQNERLDHIALLFKNISPGWLLNSLILESGAGLIQILRPWRARHSPKSFVGVGAFNLMKKSAYVDVGGHSSIKMHPIDDLMIGKVLKKNGYSQECLLGTELVTVPWYSTIADMVRGLMKNILAVINYRIVFVPFIILTMLCLNILPYWGAVFAAGTDQLLFCGVCAIRFAAFYTGTKMLDLSPWCAFGTVFTPYITIFIILRASWKNLRDKGIIWRGTHYPLEELLKNEPLFP